MRRAPQNEPLLREGLIHFGVIRGSIEPEPSTYGNTLLENMRLFPCYPC